MASLQSGDPRQGQEDTGLRNRDLLTIDDLTIGEIEAVFSLADEMASDVRAHSDLCRGFVMASLFYEPSTRTRLSFETAMHRLGGNVVTAADISTTSLAKGESLADTARVVSSYVDVIVVRHPWEGSARAIANYAGVPVINAGDGSHEHPTQTLCDLYTLRKEKGRIEELSVALCGDLKGARTVHSLTYALARFGANIFFIPTKGYELPDYVKRKLGREFIGSVSEVDQPASDAQAATDLGELDAIYQTPAEPHQLALLADAKMKIGRVAYDVLYASRLQKERHGSQKDQDENSYVRVDRKLMKRPQFKEAIVMHPLPRVDEIAYELDEDPRSIYFKQAAYGVPIRMALLALLLGAVRPDIQERPDRYSRPVDYPVYKSGKGTRCSNPTCVSNQEAGYIDPEFWIISQQPTVFSCVYCQQEVRAKFAGSGRTRVFHGAELYSARRVKEDNLVYFESSEQAAEKGFRPGWRVKPDSMSCHRGAQ